MSAANRAIEAIDELAEYRETSIKAMADMLACCQNLRTQRDALLEALTLAIRYLEHPDVLAVTSKMALHGQVPLDRARAAIAQATEGEGS